MPSKFSFLKNDMFRIRFRFRLLSKGSSLFRKLLGTNAIQLITDGRGRATKDHITTGIRDMLGGKRVSI